MTDAPREDRPRPSLVFVHGTRLTSAIWAAQRERLGDRYRIVTPDLPGHGSRADEPFSLSGAAEAVEAVLAEELAATGQAAVVIGLSLGGYVAMDLAGRRPDLVRALVIAGASAEPTGLLSLAMRGLAAFFRRVDPDLQARATAWYLRRRYPLEIAEPIIEAGFWSAGGADALTSLRAERFAARLAAYPGPTLILVGAWDPFFRLGARTFATAAVDARRVRLPRASHLANLDQPAAFSAAVARFVEGLPAVVPDMPGPAGPSPGGRLRQTPDAPRRRLTTPPR